MALTATEMMYEAKIIYESIASANAPGYTEREWSVLLTQAQEKVVLEIYEAGMDEDESQRRAISPLFRTSEPIVGAVDASTAIASRITLPHYDSIVPSYIFDISDLPVGSTASDLFRISNVSIGILVNAVWVYTGAESLSFDAYYKNRYNPFANPDINDYFWYMSFYDHKLKIPLILAIIDQHVVSPTTDISLIVDYLSKPEPIIIHYSGYNTETLEGIALSGFKIADQDCKLHPSVHRRIVERAARLAMATQQEQLGYQLQMVDNKALQTNN